MQEPGGAVVVRARSVLPGCRHDEHVDREERDDDRRDAPVIRDAACQQEHDAARIEHELDRERPVKSDRGPRAEELRNHREVGEDLARGKRASPDPLIRIETERNREPERGIEAKEPRDEELAHRMRMRKLHAERHDESADREKRDDADATDVERLRDFEYPSARVGARADMRVELGNVHPEHEQRGDRAQRVDPGETPFVRELRHRRLQRAEVNARRRPRLLSARR